MTGRVVHVDDTTRVAESRRAATVIAESEGLADTGKAALVASELASNLQKHGIRGELHIRPLSARGEPGIELLAIDRGPGMRNLTDSMLDGNSTTGTAGTGLGAVRRLSDEFDGYSELDRGTVLLSRIYARPAAERKFPGLRVGLTQRPIAGEEACGDSWAVRFDGTCTLMMVADGLGHGALAEEASAAAVRAFQNSAEQSPASLLDILHGALRSTRGAAIAIARLEYDAGHIQYCGVGNIVGQVVTPARGQAMVSHNGTVGHQIRRTQEFTYPLTKESVVVMHSDGMSGNWSLNAHPGLFRRDPSIIGAVLYRQTVRERDDACVIAGRHS